MAEKRRADECGDAGASMFAQGVQHARGRARRPARASRRRPPFLLETSRPGVFAAGDVRSGSVKRVASAVGEGSMAVQFVHECLEEM